MRRSPIKPGRRRKPDYNAAAWREGLGPCAVTGETVSVDPHHVIYVTWRNLARYRQRYSIKWTILFIEQWL